eukprot:s1068_g13.t1
MKLLMATDDCDGDEDEGRDWPTAEDTRVPSPTGMPRNLQTTAKAKARPKARPPHPAATGPRPPAGPPPAEILNKQRAPALLRKPKLPSMPPPGGRPPVPNKWAALNEDKDEDDDDEPPPATEKDRAVRKEFA